MSCFFFLPKDEKKSHGNSQCLRFFSAPSKVLRKTIKNFSFKQNYPFEYFVWSWCGFDYGIYTGSNSNKKYLKKYYSYFLKVNIFSPVCVSQSMFFFLVGSVVVKVATVKIASCISFSTHNEVCRTKKKTLKHLVSYHIQKISVLQLTLQRKQIKQSIWCAK